MPKGRPTRRLGDDDAPTPPLERRGEPYDDVKTPPLERVAAGELEGQPPLPEKEALPKVMAPEMEDSPTIPGMDQFGRRIHDIPSADADPTDPDRILDPTSERRVDATLEVTAPRRGSGPRWLVIAVLVLAATGAGLWLWQRSAPLPTTRAVPVVVLPDAGSPDQAAPDQQPDGTGPDVARVPDAARPVPVESTPGETTSVKTTRRIWLNTRPVGVRVHLGGHLLGTTPLRGVAIPAGRAVLTLSHPGYHDRRLPLGPGRRPVRLHGVGLRPRERDRAPRPGPPGRGVLQVAVQDAVGLVAADVYLDGKKIGQSPLYHRGVPAGPHQVQARRAGYETTSLRVSVEARKDNSVVLMLRRAK